MNNPSTNLWMSSSNSSGNNNGGNDGNAAGGIAGQGQVHHHHVGNITNANNNMIMNLNNMNVLASLNTNPSSFTNHNANFNNNGNFSNNSNTTDNSNGMASHPFQLQVGKCSNLMTNNGFILPNHSNDNATVLAAAANNFTPMNGLMDAGGFPQTNKNKVTVFQVKTGGSMAQFLSGENQHQPPPHQQQHGENHSVSSHNIDHNGGSNNEEMARCFSEPMLNQLSEMTQSSAPVGFNNDNAQSITINRQLEKWGIEDPSTDLNGSNSKRHAINNTMTNFTSSGGGGSGANNSRRRSEPPMNMLAEFFDQSIDGWSSPPPQESALGSRRSNSAPLDIMYDLHNLEPEKIFPDRLEGSSHNKQLQENDQLNTSQDIMSRRDGSNRTANGKLKRSRSADAYNIFQRVGGETNHRAYNVHTKQTFDNQPHDIGCKGGATNVRGPSDEEMLESREKPKRRRSLPLLSQDMFGTYEQHPEGWEEGQNSSASNASVVPAGPLALGASPQDKNSKDLLDMLLGIENGASNVLTAHQMQSTTALSQQPQKLSSNGLSLISAPIPQHQFPPNNVSISQPIHQQIPKPTNRFMSMSAAPQSQPQSTPSRNLCDPTDSITQQQLPSDGSFMSNPNPSLHQIMMPNNQPVGSSFAPPASTNNNSSQSPPPLSINNPEDLTLVLSAVKETQTNLRTLQSLVMQLGDPTPMEELAAAFKITATSSQFVLSSDLPSAYSNLNEAWAKIKKLEDLVAQMQTQQQTQQQPLSNDMGTNFSAGQGGGMMKQMAIFQQMALQDQMCGSSQSNKMEDNMVMGVSIPSITNSYIPQGNQKKKWGKNSSGTLDHQPITPISSGVKPLANILKGKAPLPLKPPKGKSKASEMESPSTSPEIKTVDMATLPPQDRDDPKITMSRLKGLMDRTQMSQKQLQKWDKKNGLPKSHSLTMVNSSRSRHQLQKGVVLKKWNGNPLIIPQYGEGETVPTEQTRSLHDGQEENHEQTFSPSQQESAKEQEQDTSSQEERQEEPTDENETDMDGNDAEESSSGGPTSLKTTARTKMPCQKEGADPSLEGQRKVCIEAALPM